MIVNFFCKVNIYNHHWPKKIAKYLLFKKISNLAEVWKSTLHIQLNVGVYEAIWSYPVYSLLSLGLLATETSLKAKIDTAASVQCPFSFRLVLEVPISKLGFFFTYSWNSRLEVNIFHFFQWLSPTLYIC